MSHGFSNIKASFPAFLTLAALILFPDPVFLSAKQTTSNGSASIYGFVHAVSDSTAIQDAAVWLVGTGHIAFSNEMGYFRIKNVPAGSYIFEIRATGHDSYRIDIGLSEGEALQVDAYLASRTVPKKAKPFRRHFSLKLSGGLNRWLMTDWNEHLIDNPERVYVQSGRYDTFEGEDLKWGRDGEIELVYHPSSTFRIGLGTGYSWGNSYYISEERGGRFTYREYESLSVRTIPVLLTIYSSYPFNPYPLYMGLGIGYYMSSVAHRSNNSNSAPWRENISSRFEGRNMGCYAVLGGEHSLTRNSSVVIELKGNYIRISGLEGKTTERTSNEAPVEYDSILYTRHDLVHGTGQFKSTKLEAFPRDTEPENHNKALIWRKSLMDHSGVSLRVGLAYHF